MKTQCDFCKELNKIQSIHCNSCIKNHQICSTCLVEYKQEMKLNLLENILFMKVI